MIHRAFPAMGTTIDVIADTESGICATRELFKRLEGRFSRFDPESELSRLNHNPASLVVVSEPMRAVLGIAANLRERTSGVFEPAVGSAVLAWGYDRTFDDVDGISEAPVTQASPHWSLQDNTLQRDEGVVLDLGGLVKGWAADQAVEDGMASLVSAGGDVRSSLEEARVEIIEGYGESIAACVLMCRGGLATSSTKRRRWKVGTGEGHHLLDPTTMAPAVSPVLSATAVCTTAAEAEAAAKTVLIRGSDGLSWAADQEWVDSAMVTWHDGSVYASQGWSFAA